MGPVGELLEKPENWISTGTATNSIGHHVPPNHPDACVFSLRGAIMRAYPNSTPEIMERFLRHAHTYYPGMTWEKLNRSLTHQILMMLLEETGI